jgi:hypothetical protein
MKQRNKTRSFTNRLLIISSSVYFFLAGVMVSVSVNLYTGIFSSDTAPHRWIQITAAVILTAISALLWSLLAWRLEELQRVLSASKGAVGDRIETWSVLISGKRRRLIVLFWGGIIAAAVGLVLLPLKTEFPKTAAPGPTPIGSPSDSPRPSQ